MKVGLLPGERRSSRRLVSSCVTGDAGLMVVDRCVSKRANHWWATWSPVMPGCSDSAAGAGSSAGQIRRSEQRSGLLNSY